MRVRTYKNKTDGFALVEVVLLVVAVTAIAGVGVYVLHHRHGAKATLSNNAQTVAPAAGTTASVDQLTQQDANTETGVDNAADASTQQNATSANAAISNVGGAYNEASY